MSSPPILVTGALGTIGSQVTEALHAAGVPVRAAELDAAATEARFPGVEAVPFNFTDPATWQSFENVTVMFLVRPPALSNIGRDMVPSLEAAKRAGVEHIVLLSLQGAESNRVVPHAKIEAWLRDSGLAWTFVRPSFFMENLSGTHAGDIRDRDCLLVPAGTGRTSFVAAQDVAAVAAAALLDPDQHRFTAWTPTGAQALTYYEVAAILSNVAGRTIRYGKPGLPRYLVHAVRTLGLPLPMAMVTAAIYTVARLGKADGLTGDVQTVTGHEPILFEDWALAHKAVWM